mmetsp:Transcript_4239/g.8757  ORF Transcript_4239/g.8757 Transcript_4239/m.8757 type:complete len:601 (-) Transcript_4239:248-2050(-)
MGADPNTIPTDAGSGSGTSSPASPGNTKNHQAGDISDPKKSGKDDSGKTPQIQSDNSNSNNSPESNLGSNPDSKNTNNNANVSLDDDGNEDEDPYSDSKDDLLTMNFNQDGGCLAVGTGSGFRICNVSPFQETFRRRLGGAEKAGIAHIEMLYRTNMLALTGHTTSPHYPPNKVLIYDDHLQRTVGELSFRQKVLATKLRRDRIIVVLRDRVYVYNFSDLDLLDKVHTGDNPRGLIGVSLDNTGVGGISSNSVAASVVERAEEALGSTGSSSGGGQRNGLVLACPSTQRGQVRVELYGLRRTTFVDAHESALGALALSVDGSLLATASERGTVIRLFDTRGVTVGGGARAARDSISSAGSGGDTTSMSSSVPLREFRRGVERATISCLTFSSDSRWLGCASDHGTVHVFQAMDPNNANNNDTLSNADSKKSRSSSMTGKAMRMLPKLVVAPKKYLMDGEQSYAQVRGIPHPQACAFVPDKECTIAVAGSDDYGNGCLLLAEFGTVKTRPHGSGQLEKSVDTEARRLGYHRFFKKGGAASMHKSGTRRHRLKSKDASAETEIGGAYIDESPVEAGLNDIQIGDENEDEFVPIDYNEKKSDS